MNWTSRKLLKIGDCVKKQAIPYNVLKVSGLECWVLQMGSPAMLVLAVRQPKKKDLTGIVLEVCKGVFCMGVCWGSGEGRERKVGKNFYGVRLLGMWSNLSVIQQQTYCAERRATLVSSELSSNKTPFYWQCCFKKLKEITKILLCCTSKSAGGTEKLVAPDDSVPQLQWLRRATW